MIVPSMVRSPEPAPAQALAAAATLPESAPPCARSLAMPQSMTTVSPNSPTRTF
ncbi:MAG: hypothetical protein U0441_20890 [Polyangiaceae bacterium]